MSEKKSIFDRLTKENNQEVESFADNPGTPANSHAKKNAKQKNNLEKTKEKFSETIHTIKDGKILRVVIKHNGAYSTYIGRKKMYPDEKLKALISDLSKVGKFIPEHEYDDYCNKTQQKLSIEYNKTIGK